MSILNKTRESVRKGAEAASKFNEHKNVKRIKRLTIIIFALLIILDVVFVLPNPFPTFSRTILDSSPKYIFIIWLWGIMTANIFFPRKVKNIFMTKMVGLIFIIVISLILVGIGNNVSELSMQLDCTNFQFKVPPAFTEVICRNDEGTKIDCIQTVANCAQTKYDITTSSKLGLLLFGFVFGYFLWPQTEREPSSG